MHVFVTGASGWVGSHVVKELLAAGHKVTGLSRSTESAALLTSLGAIPHQGDLTDVASLTAGASASDAVIHCGFRHDFFRGNVGNFPEACKTDEIAIQTLGAALGNTGKPLISTSGTAMLADGSGRYTVETDSALDRPGLPRRSEAAAMGLLSQGVKAMSVRLPPTVHGEGDKGFVPALIMAARDKRESVFVRDGANHWPAVHVRDAAKVYVEALKKGKAGAVYHAVGEEKIPTKDIAAVIGKHLDIPTVSISPEEASQRLGFIGHIFGMDNPTKGDKTKQELGVEFKEIGLLDDLELGHYFANKA